MKRRLFRLAAIAACVLLPGIGAMACGDDDDDASDGGAATSPAGDGGAATLAPYLQDVSEIQQGVSEAADSIGGPSSNALADPPLARQSLSAAIDLAESSVTALQTLDPPNEAASEHEALIAAGESLLAVVQALLDEIQDMEAGPAFDALVEDAQAPGSDLSNAIDEVVSACESLRTLAAEFETGVELSCPAPGS